MEAVVQPLRLRTFAIRGASFLTGLMLLGCGGGIGSGQKLGGLDRFHASVIEQRLFVSFVATELQWDQGVTLPIPGLPENGEATVSFAPDLQSKGTVFQFTIALAALTQYAKAYPESGLPDGRPLPDVNGGRLPRWDVTLRDRNLSFYLSQDVFGFYFPLNLTLPSGLPLLSPIRIELNDERGNRWGYCYAMGDPQPGVLVLVPFINPRSVM